MSYYCKYCDFQMNFETWEIQKHICIKCGKIKEKILKEIAETTKTRNLRGRNND